MVYYSKKSPYIPLLQRGTFNSPLGKRGVRGDYLINIVRRETMKIIDLYDSFTLFFVDF